MRDVPDLMQRIAGKSIPLEVRPVSLSWNLADSSLQKFVARRAKKYVHQGNRLVLPGIELGYVLNCMGMAPRFALFETHLHQISAVLAELHACKDPASWGKHGDEYWDGQSFLTLIVERMLTALRRLLFGSSDAWNRPEVHCSSGEAHRRSTGKVSDPGAGSRRASDDFLQVRSPLQSSRFLLTLDRSNVISNGTKIQHDQFLVWFARASNPFPLKTRSDDPAQITNLVDCTIRWDSTDEQQQSMSSFSLGRISKRPTRRTKGKSACRFVVSLLVPSCRANGS